MTSSLIWLHGDMLRQTSIGLSTSTFTQIWTLIHGDMELHTSICLSYIYRPIIVHLHRRTSICLHRDMERHRAWYIYTPSRFPATNKAACRLEASKKPAHRQTASSQRTPPISVISSLSLSLLPVCSASGSASCSHSCALSYSASILAHTPAHGDGLE